MRKSHTFCYLIFHTLDIKFINILILE
uniref:Uncharacterized protein n=1 Tax=Anguilla anguilla TaxID=7936 RepID=A0A0E9VP09_ANGAN